MHFQAFYQHYGLVAVFAVLFLENFGLPVPGEVALLFAAFHLRRGDPLAWLLLCLGATAACVVGEAIGYGLGLWASDWVTRVFRLRGDRRQHMERYFHRFGAATILVARFIAGLRVLAGPVAGLNRMRWREFMACNLLGALAWVVVVVTFGTWLGPRADALWNHFGHLQIIAAILGIVLVWIAWMRLHGTETKSNA